LKASAVFRRISSVLALAGVAFLSVFGRADAFLPAPLAQLTHDARKLAATLAAPTALEVFDLSTGYHTGVNSSASMPAASTIKIPVMVEVFSQLQAGKFDLQRRVQLTAGDKDWGSGDLCEAPVGTTYPISTLLDKMIDVSDNTATNMLIRLVGRRAINRDMSYLGLRHTQLTEDIRTDDWGIRQGLRTSPADLVRLLSMMARRELVDQWSSNEMISILEQDQFNTLIPEPLPLDIPIAHKTGSFSDTLNDAGIVYAGNGPYVIAVMTTSLRSQDAGRRFIHTISKLTYAYERRLATWRVRSGLTFDSFDLSAPGQAGSGASSPDLNYWGAGTASNR
jgi:beta-lactamase class A